RRARGDRDIAAALRRTVRAPPESGHSCPSPEHEPDMLAPCRCPGRGRLGGCVPEAACHGGRSGGRSCAARASSTRGASVEACPGWGYLILSALRRAFYLGPDCPEQGRRHSGVSALGAQAPCSLTRGTLAHWRENVWPWSSAKYP